MGMLDKTGRGHGGDPSMLYNTYNGGVGGIVPSGRYSVQEATIELLCMYITLVRGIFLQQQIRSACLECCRESSGFSSL
jgi:hypothetical protein